MTLGLVLSLAYYVLLEPTFDAFSWHTHLINSVAILLDGFIIDNEGNYKRIVNMS